MEEKKIFNFYNIDILSVYQNNPDIYEVYTDNFEGRILIRDDYYETLSPEERIYIDVQFGFRTKKDGKLALAVYLPDFEKSSISEQRKWQGFQIKDYSVFEKNDERFKLFFNRYIVGDWNIDNGILSRIQNMVSEINALTEMTLNSSLFKNEEDVYLVFPSAENNHKYQKAHIRVYGFLYDNLVLETIRKIAAVRNIKTETNKKIRALEQITTGKLKKDVFDSFRNFSKQRALATHNVSKPPHSFPAFSQFNLDMEDIFKSLKLLKEFIENTTNISAESCMKRKKN